MPAFQLKILVGPRSGDSIPIDREFFLIGRAFGCHLIPCSDLISRHHCLLIRRDFGVVLRDLGSKNGTTVNRLRTTEDTLLIHGDQIQIGKLEFEFIASCSRNAGPVKSLLVDWVNGLSAQLGAPQTVFKPTESRLSSPLPDPQHILTGPADKKTCETELEQESMSFSDDRNGNRFRFVHQCPCGFALKQIRKLFSKTQ